MKKITVIVVCFMLFFNFVFSQTKNLVALGDSSLVMDNIYVGVLNNTAFNSELKAESSYSFRVGGMATWKPSNWLNVWAVGIYGRADNKDVVINFVSFKIHSKSNKIGLEFGRMPTLSTELTNMPLSAAGQFGTWAESQVIGPAVGAKAKWAISEKHLIGAELNLRMEKPEYHLKFESDVFTMSACYSDSAQRFQSAILLKTERFYSLTVFDNCNQSNMLANFTSIPLSKKLGLELCLDAGYRFDTGEIEKLELGLLKTFQSKWLKGLLYLCYKQESRSIDTCILLHI